MKKRIKLLVSQMKAYFHMFFDDIWKIMKWRDLESYFRLLKEGGPLDLIDD